MPALDAHLPPGERFDASAAGSPNLSAAWARHWRAAPDRVQIHDPDSGWIRQGELEAESAARAGRLAALGLSIGDRVLLSAESSADLVLSYVACLRMGLVVIPTNTAYRPRELEHVIRDARPRAALIDDSQRRAAVAALDPALHCLEPSLDLPDGPTPRLETAKPQSPALLCYTSGTTGQPKGAVLSHANCLASAEGLRLAWRWTEDDRLLLALPLFHMHGLGVGLHGTLATGSSALLFRSFRPDDIITGIERFDATLFFGVPTMYHRLASHPDASALARLRLCVSGSAPLPPSLHEEIERVSGQRVLERYGMTETLMLVSNPYSAERRPGSVGFPLPGVDLRLEGEPAEIQVRGPNVFEGYWERGEANAEAFTADGWFRTGDLGEIDRDGYVRIVGRAKELIISGGYNVYPREVEDVLRTHPGIEDVAVLGEPSQEWGEKVVAYAVCAKDLELDAVREFAGDRLAFYKHPRALYAVAALPRNALGKVQKHRLAKGSVLDE
ncbi:MAG: long-chain fatty acid--CoA ligase [Deltaproteobacteria bacterium]|nr:long-chain fatty acid--CoA ligase [Deltaproteobacteria bacterium]